MRDREQLEIGRAARESIGIWKELSFRMQLWLAELSHDVGIATIGVLVVHGIVRDQCIAHVRERRAFDESDAMEQNLPGAQQREQASRRQSWRQLVLPRLQLTVAASEPRPNDPDLRLIQQTASVQRSGNVARAG